MQLRRSRGAKKRRPCNVRHDQAHLAQPAFYCTLRPQIEPDRTIGCTGGQHRSVYLVERLAKAFGAEWATRVRHREIDGWPAAQTQRAGSES
jgi:hypothetical protein